MPPLLVKLAGAVEVPPAAAHPKQERGDKSGN